MSATPTATGTAGSAPLVFDPYDYAFHKDPYPTYARLREEDPVHHAVGDDLWVISRHADVFAALRDDEVFSNRMGVSLDASAWSPEAHRVMSFLALDGAEQARVRKLVSAAFTPRRVRELTPEVQRLTEHYLAGAFAVNREQGETDWIRDFAGKLPMDVISQMMGVPVADRDEVRRLADLVVHREDGVRDVPAAGVEASFALFDYYAGMVEERRARPGEDLTSALLAAEVDGERLRDGEVKAFLFLMVVAGNETTTKLLGNALYHLSAHPAQRDEVLGAPDRGADPETLVVPWIEETLRHDTSSQMLARYVVADTELSGVTIPAGAKALVLLGSANRDERVFTDPSVYDIHRDRAELAQSLSFGTGRHFCLGANLARLEAKVVLNELVRRVQHLEVHAERAVRVHSTSVRGFASLPVTFTERTS
ncbi:cytochrome P450 [Nocardioides sp. zg-536]|uniref:Cytochrome P450 n=1 Tax=Nocardioides faecalis TaxID=2803858 RepID=A0A939BTQ1_9ACTN|nr:cytochrome P450 [Nocardioides faecalis]MBM9460884.1 cytochrome P450 [Nocardioides faecalis]MBS4751859.1 cytochrome P450 [Nocardioides faecalis]QVI59288.1 cytochrome P450 [Nocardioides faecalis]